jgi:hypothetical protein
MEPRVLAPLARDNRPAAPHIERMKDFDYSEPAEIYASRGRGSTRRPMKFHRFETVAQAVRFAMEILPAEMLAGTVLESGEDRYEAKDIRRLYESDAYPLERSKPRQAPVAGPFSTDR